MKWTATRWPAAMVNLSDEVRTKAIEFANSLINRGYGASRALSTGITMAREWRSGLLERKRGGAPFQVKPTHDGWRIVRAGFADIDYRFNHRADALRRGQELARQRRTACVVLDEHGAVAERFDFGVGEPATAPQPAEPKARETAKAKAEAKAEAEAEAKAKAKAEAEAEAKAKAKAEAEAKAKAKAEAEKKAKAEAEKKAKAEAEKKAKAEAEKKAEADKKAEAEAKADLEPGADDGEMLSVRKGGDGWIVASGEEVLATQSTKTKALADARKLAKGRKIAIYKTSGELQKVEDA